MRVPYYIGDPKKRDPSSENDPCTLRSLARSSLNPLALRVRGLQPMADVQATLDEAQTRKPIRFRA